MRALSHVERASAIQTFLPYRDFAESARVLDDKRLGKQRVETLQIMQVLLGQRLISKRFSHNRLNHVRKTVEVFRNIEEDEWTLEEIKTKAWISHSVTRMWRSYEWSLLQYQYAICDEWTSRGYQDTCRRKTEYLYEHGAKAPSHAEPFWLGNEPLHASHRGALLHKNPEHYSQFGWTETPAYEYVWPVP